MSRGSTVSNAGTATFGGSFWTFSGTASDWARWAARRCSRDTCDPNQDSTPPATAVSVSRTLLAAIV